MTYEFKFNRRVEFSETDMAGIVHFSNYFRYMESAEHAFFRSLGLSVHTDSGESMEGWARVSAACDYFAPLRYPDIFEIRLLVAEKGGRSLTYIGEVYKEGVEQPVARARWTVVRIERAPGNTAMRSIDIPKDVASLITVAPAERLPGESGRPQPKRQPTKES